MSKQNLSLPGLRRKTGRDWSRRFCWQMPRNPTMRRNLFEDQNEIERQRVVLIANIERKLQQQANMVQLLTIRWRSK